MLALLTLAWFCATLLRSPVSSSAIRPEGSDAQDVRTAVAPATAAATAGESPASVEGSRSEAERVETLPAGVALTGRVIGLEGTRTYEAVRVLLWEAGSKPDCAQFARAGPRSGAMRLVRAGSDGSFTFEGLDAEQRYHVRAGSAGQVSLALPQGVQPADGPVTLELARVKGLRVELVGTDGKPPRVHPALAEEFFVLSGSEVSRAGALLEPWEQELLGIPGTGCGADLSTFGRLLVLSSPPLHSRLGPITCFAELPGYVAASPTYWAGLVFDEIPLESLVLRSSASGWGVLEVELNGLSDEIREHVSGDSDLGELSIFYEDWSKFSLPVKGGARLRRFEGLPFGALRWSYRSPHGFEWPRDGGKLPLRVDREPCRATLDLSQAGALHVRFDAPSNPEPLPFDSTRIVNDRGGSLIAVASSQLPWTALVVEPGTYKQLHVSFRPPGKQGTISFLSTVRDAPTSTVEPGAVATLALSPEPPRLRPAAR